MTIDARGAVERAFEHAKHLFSDTRLVNLRLEQIEYDEGDHLWMVTLGFDSGRTREVRSGLALFPETTRETERVFKTFYIDGDSGDMKKMLMYNE